MSLKVNKKLESLSKQKLLMNEQPIFLDKEEKARILSERVGMSGIFFEVFDWVIFSAYLLFFFKLDLIRWSPFFILMLLFAVVQTLIYHRIFYKKLLKTSSRKALQIDLVFFLVILLLFVQLVGGISSPIIFIYIILLAIVAFAFNQYAVFGMLLIEYIFIYFSSVFSPEIASFVSQYYDLFFWEVVFLSLSAVLLFILSSLYLSERKFHEKLEYFSNQLVADKVKSEAVLESMSDGVIVVDRERKIIFMNDAALSIIGSLPRDRDKFISHFYGSVFKFSTDSEPLDFDKNCPLEIAMSESKANFRRDLTIPSYKDPIFIAMSSAPIVDASGNVKGAVAVMRDITKEKEIERLQSEFISIASHELLTPITQIQGHLSMLIDEHIGKVDETAQRLVGNAYDGTKRIGRLVRDLMNVSHIERGTMNMNMEDIDIVEFLDKVANDYAQQASDLGLYVKMDRPVKKLSTVNADSDRLLEVITNLINNSLKFTKDGGVTMAVSEKKDKTIVVSVTDTGVGIPHAEIPHLFQKFYQVDSSATREAQGTGLGLYISKKMLEMMGGDIWLESKLNKGTTFYFSLKRSVKTK